MTDKQEVVGVLAEKLDARLQAHEENGSHDYHTTRLNMVKQALQTAYKAGHADALRTLPVYETNNLATTTPDKQPDVTSDK